MAGDVVKERLEVGGAAETMEKLQTCSILLQRWWYSSKLSDTLCMLLMALVIWRPASSRAEELAKWNVPNREERRRLILSHTFCARVISSCASLRLLSTCSLSQRHDSCSRFCSMDWEMVWEDN
jgi:hypothetical protein